MILARFQNETFFLIDIPSRTTNENVISALAETSDGTFYFGTAQGLCELVDGKLKFVENIPGLPQGSIRSLAKSRSGEFWIFVTEETGVTVGRIQGQRFVRSPDSSKLDSFRISGTQARGDSDLWLICEAEGDAHWAILSEDGRISQPQQFRWGKGGVAWVIHSDRSGAVWLGTNGEGVRKVYADGRFEAFGLEQGLSSLMIRSSYEDREGNLWVGTDGGGVNQIRRRPLQHYGRDEGMQLDIIYSLAPNPSGGVIVASHGGGVSLLDGKQFSHSNGIPGWPAYAWSVFLDSKSNLWAGSLMTDGLYRTKNGRPISLGLVSPVRAIAEDSGGGIWAGGDGLVRIEGEDTQVLNLTSLKRPTVSCFGPSGNGDMWIGTEGQGLFKYSAGRFDSIGVGDGLPHSVVNAVHLREDGKVWVGTEQGLARIWRGEVRHVGRKHGLLASSIRGIAEDSRGYLWLSTGEGIERLSLADANGVAEGRQEFLAGTLFDRNDGMSTRECTRYTHPKIARSLDGKLWFPTLRGVVAVDPNLLVLNSNPPPVVLESILVDGVRSPFPSEFRDGASDLTLAPGTQRLEIHYAALSYTAPTKVRFRHRLVGVEPSWTDAAGARMVVYERLPPGKYRFELVAANGDGIWNMEGISFAIRVEPFLWQTPGFWMVGLLCGLGELHGSGAPFLIASIVGSWHFWNKLRRLRGSAIELRETCMMN